MPSLRAQLKTLMAARPPAKPVYLEATGWFYDVAPSKIVPIQRAFRKKFRAKRAELIELLGKPDWTLPGDRAWFDQWYLEALEAAAWKREGRILCLAVEHEDKESPVALALQCLTERELAKRSE